MPNTDPSLPGVTLPPSAQRKDLLYRTGRQIRYSAALMPWMSAYAEWLILECLEPPTWNAKVKRAAFLSRQPVNRSQLALLEQREDFLAYCDELKKGPLEQARAKFQKAFPTYIEAHAEALDTARRAGDYNAVARLSEPVLDRVMPKKADGIAATQINITLTPQQAQGMITYEAPPILVVEEAEEKDDKSE